MIKDHRGKTPTLVLDMHDGVWFLKNQFTEEVHVFGPDKPTHEEIRPVVARMIPRKGK